MNSPTGASAPVGLVLHAIAAAVVLAACNLPGSGPESDPAVATAAALTVQAALTTPSALSTVPPSPAATSPSGVTFTATDNVNCRSGPGTSFERLTVVQEGTIVPILARATEANWFQVDPPDISQSCWVSAEFGVASGNVGSLPAATSSVDAAAGAPTRPANFNYTYNCTGAGTKTVTTNLTWTDSANNENGYRVYRDGVEVAELPVNSTGYVDVAEVPVGHVLTFGIEAFNAAGPSARRTFSFSC